MSLHDSYARRTPFELTFPDLDEAEALFRRIAEEASARSADVGNPHQFAMLGAVGSFIGKLRGPDGPAQAVHEYGALAYHAFHFAAAGHRLDLVGTDAARALTAPDPVGGEPEPPGESGYVQLPQHLFWTTAEAGGTPQSVDGFFWTLADPGFLRVLVVLGVRADQGLLVVPLPEAPWGDRADWVDAPMRGDGPDFHSSLPGAELDGLLSFESAGEVLKLLARVFVRIGRGTSASEAPVAGPPDAQVGRLPVPSAFPFFRLGSDG